MSAKFSVLSVMDGDRDALEEMCWDRQIAAHDEARAAVAELMEDVEDFLTDMANGLGPDPERLHAALARCGK